MALFWSPGLLISQTVCGPTHTSSTFWPCDLVPPACFSEHSEHLIFHIPFSFSIPMILNNMELIFTNTLWGWNDSFIHLFFHIFAHLVFHSSSIHWYPFCTKSCAGCQGPRNKSDASPQSIPSLACGTYQLTVACMKCYGNTEEDFGFPGLTLKFTKREILLPQLYREVWPHCQSWKAPRSIY